MGGDQKIFHFKMIGNTFVVHMTIEVFNIKSNKCQYKSQWYKVANVISSPSSGRHQFKLMGECVIFSVIVKKPPVASDFLHWMPFPTQPPKGIVPFLEFSLIKQTYGPLCYEATNFSVTICSVNVCISA